MREWYANMVERQPTAYDVNKVVERFEEPGNCNVRKAINTGIGKNGG